MTRTDPDFIKTVGQSLTAMGCPVTLEYPCYLACTRDGLSISIGPCAELPGTWNIDYDRDGQSMGSRNIDVTPAKDIPLQVAALVLAALLTARVEDQLG